MLFFILMYASIIIYRVRLDYFTLFHRGSSSQSNSCHLTYISLFLTLVMWSWHLKSYLSMLGENRSNSAYLVQQNLISNTFNRFVLFSARSFISTTTKSSSIKRSFWWGKTIFCMFFVTEKFSWLVKMFSNEELWRNPFFTFKSRIQFYQ